MVSQFHQKPHNIPALRVYFHGITLLNRDHIEAAAVALDLTMGGISAFAHRKKIIFNIYHFIIYAFNLYCFIIV